MRQRGSILILGLSIVYLLHRRTYSIKINYIGKFRDTILELLYNSNCLGRLSKAFSQSFVNSTIKLYSRRRMRPLMPKLN